MELRIKKLRKLRVSGIRAKINSLIDFPERNELDEDELLAGLGVRIWQFFCKKAHQRSFCYRYLLSYFGYGLKQGGTDSGVKFIKEDVRISPELHWNIVVYAIEHGKSLNAVVEEAIGNMVG